MVEIIKNSKKNDILPRNLFGPNNGQNWLDIGLLYNNDRHKIGIFVDFPNIDISVREEGIHQHPDMALIKKFCATLGSIKIFKIYGDWNRLVGSRKYLKNIPGVKLILEPHIITKNGVKKDTVDMGMAFDIGYTLLKNPDIDLYVIITGDADFMPILRRVKEKCKTILIIAEHNSLSPHLKKKAQNIVLYQQLLDHYSKYNKIVSFDAIEESISEKEIEAV